MQRVHIKLYDHNENSFPLRFDLLNQTRASNTLFRASLNGTLQLLSLMVVLIMDFFLAILMLLVAILAGLFWEEIINWIFKIKDKG
jgi:hypothetical protein